MDNLISEKFAGITLLIGMLLLFAFHILVMLQIIPFEMTWGGKIDDSNSIFFAQVFSILLTIYFGLIVAIRLGLIFPNKLETLVNISLKVMFVYFLINFFTNLWSTVPLEKLLFAPLSVFFAILAYRLVKRNVFKADSGNPFTQRN